MLRKIIIAFVGIIVLGALGMFIMVHHISQRAIPDYSKPFVIKGLRDSVRIYRDSFAMPHVYAKNSEDLYRVSGYLIAQDRLWQMDLLRHVTTGQLSSIFGKDLLDADILMRSLRIPEKSEILYKECTPEMKAAFEAFSDGINQYINDNQKKLPPEFAILGYKPELWEPRHSFNLVGYMAWDLNGSWIAEIVLHKLKRVLGETKIKELVPNFDSTQSVIYSDNVKKPKDKDWGSEMIAANQKISDLGLSVFHGSNNWAVNSERSFNGKPILANDMHLGFSAPGIWYQMHQVIEGQLDVTGVVLPGEPFVISGHNEAIAWGLTNVMNDDIDFYKEEINPADSNSYKYNGSWRSMRIKKEKIAIKGADTLIKVLKFTHRGPIISSLKGISDETISMHWLGNEWSNEIRTVFLLNRARNWKEFKNAVSSFRAVSQNVVFADTAGNIGLYSCAGVPKRKGPSWDVLPGNTDEYDWKGLVPFDSLPSYYNPPSGIAISANNKTAPAAYPYYISCWYDLPFRFDQIKNMLLSTEKHSPESFEAMQTDFHSENVRYYLPKLLRILNAHKWSGREAAALDLLNKWDMTMDAEKVAPSIYEEFFMSFINNTFSDEMGEGLYKEFVTDKVLVRNAIHRIWRNESSVFCDNTKTAKSTENFQDIVLASYKSTIDFLDKTYGKDLKNWEWGNLHQLTLKHPLGKVSALNKIFDLNRGPFGVGGSFHTVGTYSYKYSSPFECTSGASQRHIYVTGNWDESQIIIPTGNSGIPASPYYCDQTKLYIDNKYRHDWYSKEAVIRNARFTILLVP